MELWGEHLLGRSQRRYTLGQIESSVKACATARPISIRQIARGTNQRSRHVRTGNGHPLLLCWGRNPRRILMRRDECVLNTCVSNGRARWAPVVRLVWWFNPPATQNVRWERRSSRRIKAQAEACRMGDPQSPVSMRRRRALCRRDLRLRQM